MAPRGKDYQRAKRRIEVALERPAHDPDAVIETLLDSLADLLGVIGACWHHTDPSSGLPLASAALGDPAGTLEWSLDYEFRRPDVNRFEELRVARSPVASVSATTGGAVRRSARFREMIEPTGTADELRVAFVDGFGFWSALVIFTRRTMAAEDLQLVTDLLPTVSAALRRAAADRMLERTTLADDHDGPSVLILGHDDRIVSADAAARARLRRLPEPRPVELPGVIAFVAAEARWGGSGRARTARMRTTDGRWFAIDASVMDAAAAGAVSVVLRPAPLEGVLDGLLRALGLTAREREVAALAQRGHSAKAIASTLFISPWTVQDHLKAVYEKTGVGSRSELGALLPRAAAS